MLTVSSMVVVLIPALALPLLRLTNDRELMGKYKNGWFTNLVLLTLIVISLYFTYKNLISVWQQAGALFPHFR